MMNIDQQKEQFSRAYVQAVAAVAGFSSYTPIVDDDSIDLGLAQTRGNGKVLSPRLEIQLKCRAMVTPVEREFGFSIKLKNYDDLRSENILLPRILVVVIVPDNPANWLNHSETELAMHHCGYWLSIRGAPPSSNQTSQTVVMTRTQTFTVEALRSIMERIGEGGLP